MTALPLPVDQASVSIKSVTSCQALEGGLTRALPFGRIHNLVKPLSQGLTLCGLPQRSLHCTRWLGLALTDRDSDFLGLVRVIHVQAGVTSN